jgi:hypothetical protein
VTPLASVAPVQGFGDKDIRLRRIDGLAMIVFADYMDG